MAKNDNQTLTDQFKSNNNKHSLSKFEHELFKDSDHKIEKVIRVKRILSSAGEKWKIYEDVKIVYILESEKLNNKEKEFLRTPDGFNFLILQYKSEIKSLKSLRDAIKIKLTEGK